MYFALLCFLLAYIHIQQALAGKQGTFPPKKIHMHGRAKEGLHEHKRFLLTYQKFPVLDFSVICFGAWSHTSYPTTRVE